jgi:hypothetical protein
MSQFESVLRQMQAVADLPTGAEETRVACHALLMDMMRLLTECREILWTLPALMAPLQLVPLEDLRVQVARYANSYQQTARSLFGAPTEEEWLELAKRIVVAMREDEGG